MEVKPSQIVFVFHS